MAAASSPVSSSPAMRCAFGKRSWRLFASRSGSSPIKIAHTPFSDDATRMGPREDSAIAKRIIAPAPPLLYSFGLHSEHFRAIGVEASVGVKSGFVDCFGHGMTFKERLL